jgi:Holliday junction resolvase
MPNHAYERSTRREREIVNDFRSRGFICARSAGSKSPTDVWAFNPKTLEFYMIQVKTKKGGRSLTIIDKKVYNGVTAIERWYYYA